MALIKAATAPGHGIVVSRAAIGGYGGQWGVGESSITPIDICPRMRVADVIKRIETANRVASIAAMQRSLKPQSTGQHRGDPPAFARYAVATEGCLALARSA
ncbi:MAG: hypothetical protein AB1813_27855 [Verrucomicrobiota bacterium]